MKNKLITAAAVAAVFFAPQAFAQANNFEGFSIGGNVAMTKTTVDVIVAPVTLSMNDSTTGLELQLQYAKAMGPQFVLGFGVTLGTGTNKAGSITVNANTAELSSKNRTAFDVMPGFAVSDSTLIFGKVSFLSATAVATVNRVESTKDFSGMGYGVGLRTMIDKNMFFQAGYDINTYTEKDFVKPSSGVLSFGLGYKF